MTLNFRSLDFNPTLRIKLITYYLVSTYITRETLPTGGSLCGMSLSRGGNVRGCHAAQAGHAGVPAAREQTHVQLRLATLLHEQSGNLRRQHKRHS